MPAPLCLYLYRSPSDPAHLPVAFLLLLLQLCWRALVQRLLLLLLLLLPGSGLGSACQTVPEPEQTRQASSLVLAVA